MVQAGKVYLVGAGPGDPGLITVRGLARLSSADVVVYDRLIPAELLRCAPASAERIHVGKSPGGGAYTQEEINQLLVEHARAGKTVCRLKGGDPFVFGRGGEEALALAQAGIAFEVVPGVTAGVGALAYAGIPATQRGLSSSLLFVTGHEDPTKPESQVDWEALARIGGTIVVYMGVSRLSEIAGALLSGGLAGATPAAVVASGTLPDQKTVTGTLGDIARLAQEARVEPPALLVVGEVVRLREQLAWFEGRPLFGRRILVTRPREVRQTRGLSPLPNATRAPSPSDGFAEELGGLLVPSLAEQLRELGATVLEVPAFRLVPPEDMKPVFDALDRVETFHWLLFTSARAVERFFAELLRRREDLRVLANVHIAAIGVPTARAVERYHLKVDLYPSEFVAEAVLAEFAKQGKLRGQRLLLPRAASARRVLPEGLAEMGAEVVEVELYRSELDPDQDPETLACLAERPPDLVTFASASAVRGLRAIVSRETFAALCRSTPAVVIGPVTAQAAREAGFTVASSASPHTIPALVAAVTKHFATGR
jgi:uroporphyrinogen III methyltransferase/synthase